MKLFSVFCIVSVLVMFSCSQENDVVSPVCENEESATVKSSAIVVQVPFTWEWHRAKFDCKKGFGICNFEVQPPIIVGWPKRSSTIRNDSQDGRLYAIIPVDDDAKFENGSKNLYVDEDLFAVGSDDKTYVIPKGIYQIDLSIGSKGSYRLPIEVAYSLEE